MVSFSFHDSFDSLTGLHLSFSRQELLFLVQKVNVAESFLISVFNWSYTSIQFIQLLVSFPDEVLTWDKSLKGVIMSFFVIGICLQTVSLRRNRWKWSCQSSCRLFVKCVFSALSWLWSARCIPCCKCICIKSFCTFYIFNRNFTVIHSFYWLANFPKLEWVFWFLKRIWKCRRRLWEFRLTTVRWFTNNWSSRVFWKVWCRTVLRAKHQVLNFISYVFVFSRKLSWHWRLFILWLLSFSEARQYQLGAFIFQILWCLKRFELCLRVNSSFLT